MALISGQNGYVVVAGDPDVTLHCGAWSGDFGNMLANGTTSAHSGTNMEGTIQSNSWTINLPVDAAATPDDAGLIPGEKVEIYFRVGNTNTFHHLAGTTVARIGADNQASGGEMHRNSISGEGGVVSFYTAGPS